MTDQQRTYASWLEQLPAVPFFHQADWWSALWGSDWSVAFYQKGDHILGAMPYRVASTYGLKRIRPPQLTPYHGPLLVYPPDQKKTTRYSYQQEVVAGLITQLPAYQQCYLHLRPYSLLGMAFHLSGFSIATRYTYIIPSLADMNEVLLKCRENIRREIKKAEKSLIVTTSDDIGLLHQVKEEHYNQNRHTYPISLDLLSRGFQLSKQKQQGELLIAVNQDNAFVGALWYVWDNQSAYYLQGGTIPSAKNSGAMSLLLYTAMQRVADKTTAFNFEGSMIPSIERYFRNFGGEQTPYLAVSHVPSRWLRWWLQR